MSVCGYLSLQLIGIGIGRLLYVEMLSPEDLQKLKDGEPVTDLSPYDTIPATKTQIISQTLREKSLIQKLLLL